jgi:Bacterial Ig domain
VKLSRLALAVTLLAAVQTARGQAPPLFAVESGSSTIFQLNPFTGAILNSFPTPVPTHVPASGGADGLAYDGAVLYFTSGLVSETGTGATGAANRTIHYLNPETGVAFDSFELPAAGGTAAADQTIDALASDGFFLYANRPSEKIIFKIDPAAKTVVSTIAVGFDEMGGMGFNPYDGLLYVSDSAGNNVHRLDTATGESVGLFNFPGSGTILGVDFVRNKMFINRGEDIVEVSPINGRPINRFPSPFPLPSHINALAGDPSPGWTCTTDGLYTVDSGDSAISVLDPDTGAILHRFLTPVATAPTGPAPAIGGPEGLAFDGATLRYISSDHPTKSGSIYAMDPCSGAVLDEIVPPWPASAPGSGAGVDALAFGSLAGQPTLFGLRPATNEVLLIDVIAGVFVRSITIDAPPVVGLGFSDVRQSLFVSDLGASPGTLFEIDPATGSVIASRVMTGSNIRAVDVLGERLFAASGGIPGSIQELDFSGAVVNTFPSPDNQPSALAGLPGSLPPPPGPEETADVTFEVSLRTLELTGGFQPGDRVQLLGDFNDWDCGDASCLMDDAGSGVYRVTLPVTAPRDSPVHFRFFVEFDPARFGGTPPPGWEEPYSTGGGDRTFFFTGSDVILPAVFFADLLPGNIIGDGTTSVIRFSLDMNGAPGFDPARDRAFVNLAQDVFWALSQGLGENQRFELSDSDRDGIFNLDYPVSGLTTSGIQYRFAFGPDAANPVSEEIGAQLGRPGRNRTRWIAPEPGGWPASFDLPADVYQPRGALPVDPNPAASNPNPRPVVAVDDFVETDEDTPLDIDVLANDVDSGGGISIIDVTPPASGATLSDPGNGLIRFTPDPDFNGTVTFTYSIGDPAGQRDDATVTVRVLPVNDPPVARDDSRRAFEGTSTVFDLLSNDSDPDGDFVRIRSAGNGTLGETTIVGDRVRYTPVPGSTGTDRFTYVIGDGNGGSDEATVSVSIEPLPADDDGVEESTENAAPNNGDGNGDGIADSEQANVASLPSATSGQYITVAAETGSELLGVVSSTTSPAPLDQPPPAEAAFPAGFLDFQIGGGTGNRALTLEITFDPTEGINSYYKFGATPDNTSPHWYRFDFDGETGAVIQGNTITLHFVDGKRGDDDLVANGVIVDPGAPGVIPNKAPEAQPDQSSIDEDNGIVIDVLANDSDGDGDNLTVAQVTQPTNGTVSLIDGVVTYTPNPDFFGSDSFSYLVSDGNGGTVVASVTVTVNPINDAPRFAAGSSIFTLPLDGSEVIVGGENFETPVDGTETFFVQYGAAFDVEDNPVTYKWVLGTNDKVDPPVLERDTDETELSFLVSEVAEVLDGSGATPGTGVTVYHRVIASDGLLETASPVSSFVLIRGFLTALEEDVLPTEFELDQNFPNPFNPVTNIRFGLPVAGPVTIDVFDSLGRRVGTLVNATLPAGYHNMTFDAGRLASGVYIYSMRAPGFTENRRFVLLK